MKTKWLYLLVVVVALAAVLWAGSNAAVNAGPSPAQLAAMPAPAVTGEFYAWYLDMLGAEVLCHPLLDGAYRESPYVSSGLVAALDALVADSCGFGLETDPLLCSADIPLSVDSRLIAATDDAASVLVYGRFPTESPISETRVLAEAVLVQENDHWALDAVVCR